MILLDKTLRNLLERTVKDARDISEDGARAALEQLGVGDSTLYAHLSEKERSLRRGLRALGRRLGDRLNGEKTQTIDCLVEETAYEHWHRMLFARFLAENNLLMYPDPEWPVPVTLQECEDIAMEKGASSGWELAARYAADMLPQIFRPDSPVFSLSLPPEHQHRLEQLLDDLPVEAFTASDSLGWVYQFWQTKKKEEVNSSEIKIGSKELPAVTQLFTEPYMVSFLLDNSLGAWWAARRLSETDLGEAGSEEELRAKAAIPGAPLEYLRFLRHEDNNWTLAAGNFDQWPERLSDLKILDPCCGSGHFLVAALNMLAPMRMELEGLSAKEAINAVLRQNIHGLDIDRRVTEIAAFALALAAWKYPDAGAYRSLPELSIACSGLAVSAAKDEWKRLAPGRKNLTLALEWLHDVFKDAPLLGSLINPSATEAASLANWGDLSGLMARALGEEENEERRETAVAAHGLSKAADLMSGRYHLIITNVPYLARGKQVKQLKDFSAHNYPEAKNDLATVFLERCLQYCADGGTTSVVLPQNWLFLTSYKKFREKLLKQDTLHMIARLGEGGFDSSAAAGAFTAMLIISRNKALDAHSALFGKTGRAAMIRGVDVSESSTTAEKAVQLVNGEIKSVSQDRQLENPDARITMEENTNLKLLSVFSNSYQGISPADLPRFGRFFWENTHADGWKYWQSSVKNAQVYGGRELTLWFSKVLEKTNNEGGAYIRGEGSWSKDGVAVGAMRNLPCAIAKGHMSDTNVAILIPHNPAQLPAIWCFCSSPEYNEAVRQIDQSLKVTNATLVKVPFDLDRWSKTAAEKYPNGLPKPYTDDPTQWIFHGHPCGSVVWDEEKKRTSFGSLRTDEAVLQAAVARLLGYRWPAELDEDMELTDEQREWAGRCKSLLPFPDDEGIVSLPSLLGKASARDRLLDLLAASYGDAWSGDVLAELLKNADHGGKTLESWLRDKFFTQHCKIFYHRPFIWHIWDGLRDGFSVLINYHKLDRKKMESLIYTYLGDWINRQKQEIKAGIDGAEERLAAAQGLKERLELILEGEAPHDIFVRWKPLKDQPLGWNPDLNDGVRLNIRPFMTVPDVGKKGAGILRDKPNINWNKDRGSDVESTPWFRQFEGDRINDHHLTLAEKRTARGIIG